MCTRLRPLQLLRYNALWHYFWAYICLTLMARVLAHCLTSRCSSVRQTETRKRHVKDDDVTVTSLSSAGHVYCIVASHFICNTIRLFWRAHESHRQAPEAG
jgi:hypothetical protein